MAEINSRETLEAWLKDRPRDWSIVIAHRAALRVLPIALSGLRHIDRYGRLELTLVLFRLAAVSPSSSLHPNLHIDGLVAMHEAAAELFQLAPRYSRSSILIDSAAAITAFADDALEAAYAADQYSLTGAFADSSVAALTAKEASSTGAAAITSFAFAAHEVGVADGFWACIRYDCETLEQRRLPRSVLMQPLWSVMLPDVIDIEIAEYTSFLSQGAREYDLWIDWYKRRLFGHPSHFRLSLIQEEELSRRLIDARDEWWKREPALVNRDIKAWIAELTPEPDFEVIKERLQSGATTQFGSPEEQRLRADLQQQIEALQAQLDGIDPPPPPIGHNRPPIDLDEADAEDAPAVFNEVRSLTAEVKTAIQPSAPDLPATVEKLSRLQRLYRWLRKLIKESVEDFVKEGAKSAGKLFGPVALAAIGVTLLPAFQSVFSAASAWVHALF